MTSYLDTRLGSLPRTGSFVQSLGSFNTLAELNATHPANNYNPGTTAYTIDQGFMISDGSVWESPGMVPGEEDVTAATYAAARLLSGAATGARLQVRGRTTQSDGGQGLFTWVAGGTTTINDGSQLSAPGGIWQRPDVTINAQWYGIDPTGVVASDVALNLAIQDAILRKKKLVLPTGLFQLLNPLLCYSGTFSTLQMEGQGGTAIGAGRINYTYPGGAGNPNTLLWANFNDRPALILNAVRDVVLKDFCLIGNNMADGTGAFSSPYPPQYAATNYVTNGCRDSRYSPHCGICIDPFTCATPPDGGYPGMTYPQSNGSGSHDILIDKVNIQGFVVGVMNGPGTTNANGDDCTFRDVVISTVRFGYACGNSQARQIVIQDGNVGQCSTCFDTLTYGNQIGPPFTVYGTNIGDAYSLINMYANSGEALISGCYCESLVTLGQWGGGATANAASLTFDGIHHQVLNISPGAPPTVICSSGPTLFKGCKFNYTTNVVEAWNFFGNSSAAPAMVSMVFENCHFSGAIETRRIPPIGQIRNASCATLINCYINGSPTGGQSMPISDGLYRGNSGSLSTAWGNGIGRLNATCQTHRVADSNIEYIYVPPGSGVFSASSVNIGVVTALTLNATTVTFTITNASQFFCEKDILFWFMIRRTGWGGTQSVPALKIPVGGIVGNNVTANMLWDPAWYDTVANQAASNSVDILVNHWAPTGSLTCTTNSTVNLTAVSPVGTLLPGDFVIGAGPNAADIPSVIAGAVRVVSNDGAGNVVLSKTATGSHAGVGLRFGYLSPVTPVILTVATLPPGIPGLRYMVSDALGPAFGAAVVGGGAVRVPVFADNTGAWIVG